MEGPTIIIEGGAGARMSEEVELGGFFKLFFKTFF